MHHYRDKAGRQADAIVELAEGRWAAFEVKLGRRQIPGARASLAAFVADIDTARTPPPVTHRRRHRRRPDMRLPDGVLTFPLRAPGS